MAAIARCYLGPDGNCEAEARYHAFLTWTLGPVMLLCDDCLALERAAGDVYWAHSIRPGCSAGECPPRR